MSHPETNNRRYFHLFPDVIHIAGTSSNGVLYLLVEKKIFKLGPVSNEIISRVEKYQSIADIVKQVGITEPELMEILEGFVDRGAGFFSNAPYFVEKIRTPVPIKHMTLLTSPPDMHVLRISLSNRCTQGCVSCTAGSQRIRLKPCLGCWKDNDNISTLSMEQIEKALKEAALLDCERLFLTAPDPGLITDLVISTIGSATKKGFKVIEFYSGMAISSILLESFVKNMIVPTFQIFSNRAVIHDKVSGRSGGFQSLMDNMDYLRSIKHPFNLYYLETGNENFGEEIEKFKELEPGYIYFDLSIDNYTANKDPILGKKSLVAPDVDMYIKWLTRTRCIYSTLTLNSSGNYFFCPAQFDENIGSVDNMTIQDIFALENKNGHKEGTVKEETYCNDCEYNVTCHVCKSMVGSSGSDGSICGYKHQEGEWLY